MKKNQHKQAREQIQHDALARILAKEMFIINGNKKFSNKHLPYPVNTYFYDINKFTLEEQEQMHKKNPNGSFCYFNKKKACYEIFIRNEARNMTNQYFNKKGVIDFWGDKINIADSDFGYSKIYCANVLRHELAHIKISSMVDLASRKIDFKGVPPSVVNILEDVRVNSFYDTDKNLKIILPDLYKPQPSMMEKDAHPINVLLGVCASFNNPLYASKYLSSFYNNAVEAFLRVKNAKSIQETIDIGHDFIEQTMPELLNQSQDQKQQNNKKNKNNNSGESENSSPSSEPAEKNNKGMGEKDAYGDNKKEDDDYNLEGGDYEVNAEEEEYEDLEENYGSDQNQSDNKKIFTDDDEIITKADDLVDMNDDEESLDDDLLDEIRNNSDKITNDGALIRSKKKDRDFDNKKDKKISFIRKQNNKELKDLTKGFFLEGNSNLVKRGDIDLNLEIIKKATLIAEKILEKAFRSKKIVRTDKPTMRINERRITDFITSPSPSGVYMKKTDNGKRKQPIPMTFYLDLSGSMSGQPVSVAKHIIAVLKNLQDKQYINADIILHAEIDDGEKYQHLQLGKLNDKLFLEKLSYVDADGSAEALKNTILKTGRELHTTLKNSRFVCFFTDAAINDNPEEVSEAIKKISLANDKVFGIYAGERNHHRAINSLKSYFPNYVTAKLTERDINNALLVQVSSLVKAIATMANPDVSAKSAINLLKNDKTLVTSVTHKNNEVGYSVAYVGSVEKNKEVQYGSDCELQQETRGIKI